MKMADVLRSLADKLDSIEQGSQDADQGQPPTQQRMDPVGDVPGGDTDTTKMVPPLQAKLELLKKATGVDSVYDNSDELNDIKKLTGIKAVVQHEASEDNDITG
jgi:hypothetical protein